MPIERAQLWGPGVRVLNVGGATNPDVLQVATADGALVVKDYARRAAWVRRHLAERLIARELALIAQVQGAPGVPGLRGRIDRWAFAIEWIDGQPLRRRTHRSALPESFFLALETTLEALRVRGVFYADLRSPTNVLLTRTRAPALVDLASAVSLRLPRAAVRAFYRRALRKLRARFEESPSGLDLSDTDLCRPAIADLHDGGDRIRRLDLGSLGDPRPVVFLTGPESPLERLRALLEAGATTGRRIIGIELPARPALRRGVWQTGAGSVPPLGARGGWLLRAFEALRLGPCEVVATGSACAPALELADFAGGQSVHALLTLEGPQSMLPQVPEPSKAAASPAHELWPRWLERLSKREMAAASDSRSQESRERVPPSEPPQLGSVPRGH